MVKAKPRRRGAPRTSVASAFVAESRRRLKREYLPKIRRAVRDLKTADVWWRPNSASNSIGNLLLHLDGNVRQWIVHGLGGARDARRRDREFAARQSASATALVRRLTATVTEADAVLARLDPEALLAMRTIQGYRVTTLQAVYHVVEHIAGHTGQILYIAKSRLDRDLALYPHLVPRARRERAGGTVRIPARRARRFLRAPASVAGRRGRGYHAPASGTPGANAATRGGP